MSARFQDQTLEPDQTAVKARRVGSSYGGTRENFRDNFGERYFSGKTRGVADQEGFELAVRLAKFAFVISSELPAPLANWPSEKFSRLGCSLRVCTPVSEVR